VPKTEPSVVHCMRQSSVWQNVVALMLWQLTLLVGLQKGLHAVKYPLINLGYESTKYTPATNSTRSSSSSYYTTSTSVYRLFSRTTWVSRHQTGKPFRNFTAARDDGVVYQLDHMQTICTSLQTDNHASTSPLSFHRLDALPAAQPTASKHWRH